MYKKAQEEIIGFVMIMVVVAVIFLVFIGFYARSNNLTMTESTEVAQFLESVTEFTTDCSTDNGFSYKRLGSLTQECDRNTLCKSGMTACHVLNETLFNIIESSWNIAQESEITGYEMTVEFPTAQLLNLTRKTSSCNTIRGADKPLGGGITIRFEICRA